MPDYVPALQGKMGDWTYYVTAMKLMKVAKETRFVSDIHKTDELDDLMQREIGERVKTEMVPYLLGNPQRFFGALILAVYGGEPEFNPVKISEHELLDDNEKSTYGFGLLRFDGSQTYFALDGQHRLKSIQLAVESDPDLGKEEVAVIIVKHDRSTEGLMRTRRLFSTLNRRAEKTSAGLNIAIDEDDAVAITTRRLVREHPYLGGLKLVKANKDGLKAKQLSPSVKNEPYLTTLQALYECNEFLLRAFSGGMDIDREFKANRPSAEDLDAFYDFLAGIWTAVLDASPDMRAVLGKLKKAGSLRIDPKMGGGGSVLARPLGQLIYSEVIEAALRQGREMAEFVGQLMTDIPTDLDQEPWVRLVWNPESRSIVSGKRQRQVAVNLLLDKFGLKQPMPKRALLKEYRDLTLNKRAKLLSNSGSHDNDAASEEEGG